MAKRARSLNPYGPTDCSDRPTHIQKWWWAYLFPLGIALDFWLWW